ncbi:MAG: dihydrofolate reductase [Alistipes sp.]|nr:dihydrofolate reductase [Alistipes sp.]
MEKCVIAAVADNGAIGKDSDLLWHIPWRTSFT